MGFFPGLKRSIIANTTDFLPKTTLVSILLLSPSIIAVIVSSFSQTPSFSPYFDNSGSSPVFISPFFPPISVFFQSISPLENAPLCVKFPFFQPSSPFPLLL